MCTNLLVSLVRHERRSEVNTGACLNWSLCYFLEHSFTEPGAHHFNNTDWSLNIWESAGICGLCPAPSARAIAARCMLSCYWMLGIQIQVLKPVYWVLRHRLTCLSSFVYLHA